MKYRTPLGIVVLILMLGIGLNAQLFPNLGGQRTGTSCAQFLKIGLGSRAIGMGESFVAIANDAEALYWNPAGISQFNDNDFTFSHIDWFADISVDFAGLVYHLNSINSVGFFFAALTTDDMMETTELQPFGTGQYFSYSDLVTGISYARNMTDKFSFGVTAKYFQETMAELTMSAFLFDLGTYYKTGWKRTRFAVAVTNFGPELAPTGKFEVKDLNNNIHVVKDFQKFSPPIIFRIGIATELIETESNRLTTSIQLNHPNDNTENINLGVEYMWQQLIALRGGYITARTERDISLGVGLYLPILNNTFRVDYAFSNFGRLGYVNQFSAHFLF